eukprot:CAMPEP_0168422544 /NCGR_PEP_ID=MMETSP0228-20121227/33849_1 /TAXON_ID=133427 /ORGANISM="Protoceratium reticulatum, Strain CCCM 535 (=CCMP 1889)" /LENGTH=186 /DNA_ID=CAMNT_0008436481 /DNA_START=1 /DNA_END=558 /DNA_ORIENTATION=+
MTELMVGALIGLEEQAAGIEAALTSNDVVGFDEVALIGLVLAATASAWLRRGLPGNGCGGGQQRQHCVRGSQQRCQQGLRAEEPAGALGAPGGLGPPEQPAGPAVPKGGQRHTPFNRAAKPFVPSTQSGNPAAVKKATSPEMPVSFVPEAMASACESGSTQRQAVGATSEAPQKIDRAAGPRPSAA